MSFASARSAFKAVLTALQSLHSNASQRPSRTVLLPAYIGWSPREGSGVFDPIDSLKLDYAFYQLDDRLRIDIDSLRDVLAQNSVSVLVIIHYFGYVDPCYTAAVRLAREYGAFVLEDEAHALLTDLIGGASGRLGDACIFSFHKMLPVLGGGAAVFNDPGCSLPARIVREPEAGCPLVHYDLERIAQRRVRNARFLARKLPELAPGATALFDVLPDGNVPQTFPILIPNDSRDDLYHRMNSAGFGVVSLYHTLISQISSAAFPTTHWLSRHIMNLPVHQDASDVDLECMLVELGRHLRCA